MKKPEDPQDLAERAFGRRRLQDAALLLPLTGVMLFLSPLMTLAGHRAGWFGAPAAFLYIFGAWACLIVAARWMARRLTRETESS